MTIYYRIILRRSGCQPAKQITIKNIFGDWTPAAAYK